MADVNYKIKASDDFSPALDKLVKKLDGVASALTSLASKSILRDKAVLRSAVDASEGIKGLDTKQAKLLIANRNSITRSIDTQIKRDVKAQRTAKDTLNIKSAQLKFDTLLEKHATALQATSIASSKAKVAEATARVKNADAINREMKASQAARTGVISSSRSLDRRGRTIRETVRTRDASGKIVSTTQQGDGRGEGGGGGTYLGKLTRGFGLGYLAFKAKDYAETLASGRARMRGAEAGLGSIFENTPQKLLPQEYAGMNSKQMGLSEIQHLKGISSELGMSFQDNVMPYTKLLASSNMPVETTRRTYKAFMGYGKLMGVDPEGMVGTIRALEQMQSKQSVKSEELKGQLGDRLPRAVAMFAKAAGVSVPEFIKQMENGQVSANIMALVMKQIEQDHGPAMAKAFKEIGGQMGRAGYEIEMFNQSLGEKLEPTMNSFLIGVQNVAKEGQNFMNAFNNPLAFESLNQGGQASIITLKALGSGLGQLYTDYKTITEFIQFNPLNPFAYIGAGTDIGNWLIEKIDNHAWERARKDHSAPMPTPKWTPIPNGPGASSQNGKVEVEVNVSGIPMGSEVKTKTTGNGIGGVKTNSNTGSSRSIGGEATSY